MRYAIELHPGEYFLERKTGDGHWNGLSRDNDLEVMQIRYAFQVELQTPGMTVRLIDWHGKTLNEHTT